jgi:nucleoid DNA-binding protein
MQKRELIEGIAVRADTTKVEAGRMLDAFVDVVTEALAEGRRVQIVGFGAFEVQERKARAGRNPHTGETMQIPATTVPKFRPGKTLKDSVAG